MTRIRKKGLRVVFNSQEIQLAFRNVMQEMTVGQLRISIGKLKIKLQLASFPKKKMMKCYGLLQGFPKRRMIA